MKEIIKVTEQDGRQVASARELHIFLQVKENFTDWAKRMFEYGFTEQTDFIRISRESTGGRPATDYALTLDCAKEISMLQRTEKGKQARLYFIEMEKRARSLPSTDPDELLIMLAQRNAQIAREAREAKQLSVETSHRVSVLEAQRVTRPDWMAISGYATLHNIPESLKEAARLGRAATALCQERGITVDTTPDPRFGRINVYPSSILEEIFGE